MTFDFSLHPHFFFFADPVDYDCSNRTELEWEREKDPSTLVGWWFITLGVASFGVYAVLLLAMSSKETLQNGCLQLIYFNCWIDCGSIACGGLITGWLFMRGDVYCTNPFWAFAPGAVGLGCWSSSCVLCIALAFSRICALHGYEWKCINYMVMVISTVYGLFMMVLTRPVVFNGPRGSWFFSPYIQESKQIANSYHLTENILVTILTPLLYVYVCLRLFLHPAYRSNLSSANRHLQISACLQSFLICLLVCIAAVLFAYMQIFDYPSWLPLMAEIAYQICGTLPAAVLLVVNKNIRRRAIWLILLSAQNHQWQTIEPYALSQVLYMGPDGTRAQTKAFASAKGMAGVRVFCNKTVKAVDTERYFSFNQEFALKDCYNYFQHRLSLQKYLDFLFDKLSKRYLSKFKAAELKSQFYMIDKKRDNQLADTYCDWLDDVATRVFGTNRAKFFERNVNISAAYKVASTQDYYNVFFFKWAGTGFYMIADAADSCLYKFGELWGFGVYASQYVDAQK